MLKTGKKAVLLGASLLALLSSPSLAGELYGSLGGGYSIAEDSTYSGAPLNVGVDYKDGLALRSALGVDKGAVRLEGELALRTNKARTMTVNAAAGLPIASGAGGGRATLTTLMGNIYWDIDTGSALTPYLGVGLGAGVHDLSKVTAGGMIVNKDDIVFAAQGIAGVALAVADAVDVTLDYRYLTTEKGKFFDTLARRFSADYDNHAIMIGFTYRFGGKKPAELAAAPPPPPPPPAPPPPPPPAPAAVAPEPIAPPVFIVFFDFDRSAITDDAARIVREAAEAYRKFGKAKIVVTGHADRSGSNAYNMALSLRRADTVRGALIELGVGNQAMSVSGRGEDDPLVATPDGVREPQNRRVEIVLE